MARITTKVPFIPGSLYAVNRGFLHRGRYWNSGDLIPPGTFSDRLARMLFSQRRIRLATAAELEAFEAEAESAKADKEDGKQKPERGRKEDAKAAKAEAPSKKDAKAAKAEAPSKEDAKGYTIKRAGFGGWKVISPTGEAVGEGHETREAAEAALKRLVGAE